MPEVTLYRGDCLDILPSIGEVDLVFGSPPYEDARTYGIDFKLKGTDWVDWAVARYTTCASVCRGLVAWVVNGRTKNYQWSLSPALLMRELHVYGKVSLRKPPLFYRSGIPGSGGPDWLRDDYEFVICGQRTRGRLPWSDNTAMGHPPVWNPGGEPSHRMKNGRRVHRTHTKRTSKGMRTQGYNPPAIANPGNVIECGAMGGGNMGSDLAHENEAPFPERLAEFFVRSFCPPGGTVLDPFCGSGTALKVAAALGRNAVGIDIRESQIDLTRRRLQAEVPNCIVTVGKQN